MQSQAVRVGHFQGSIYVCGHSSFAITGYPFFFSSIVLTHQHAMKCPMTRLLVSASFYFGNCHVPALSLASNIVKRTPTVHHINAE